MNLQYRLTDFSYLRKVAPPDSDLVEEMIELCIENVPEYGESIKNCYQNNDREGLRQAAHKMKSSVNYMGIDSLFKLLQDLEAQAHEVASLEELKLSIDRICELSRVAVEELRQLKKESG